MALYQFLCSVAVVILLSANGCYSDPKACGKMMKGQHPKVWAWQAVIKGAGGRMCMGLLVSEHWVVTSLKCGHGQGHGTTVILGRHGNQTYGNQTQGNQTNNEQYSMVEKVKCRNLAPYGKKVSGLCLLKLDKPVRLTDSIQPICLASKYSVLHSKTKTYVLSGAPYPSAKQVPLVGQRKCQCLYPELSKGMICAERMRKGGMMDEDMMDEDMMDEDMMDYCQPGMRAMMSLQDDTWTLVGVYSDSCEASEGPRFFTSLPMNQEWISDVTGKESYTFNTIYPEEFDPDSFYECPRKCPDPDEDCDDGSIFDGGASMTPFSPFILLCVLVLSLCFPQW